MCRYHHPINRHPHPELLLICSSPCLSDSMSTLPSARNALTSPCFTLLSSTLATLSGRHTRTTGRWCATYSRSFHRRCTGCQLPWRYCKRLLPDLHKKNNATDIDVALGHTHDWIKAEIARNQLGYKKVKNIFPSTNRGSSYTSALLLSLDKSMKMTTQEDVAAFLIKIVQVEQSSLYVVSYLDRKSGWLHDKVLTKTWNAFFRPSGRQHTRALRMQKNRRLLLAWTNPAIITDPKTTTRNGKTRLMTG